MQNRRALLVALAVALGLATVAVRTQLGPTTVTFKVAAGVDDVSEVDTTFDANSTPFWIGNGGSAALSFTGLRLTNVTLPAGAAIQSARLEVYSTQSQWIGLEMSIFADATGNSAPFSSTSRPSQRPPTTQAVAHNSDEPWAANTWYAIADIAPVVQELVSRPDWGPGNSLSVLIRGTSGPFSRKMVNSFEQNASFAARLIVTYFDAAFRPPTISNVSSSDLTTSSATITWNTDEPATSQVEYGRTTSYGSSTTPDTTLTTAHSQGLSALSPATTYHFRVISTDADGNTSTSQDYTLLTASTNADIVGQWSTVMSWPLVPVHATLMHTGNVLVWDAWEVPTTASGRVWNPVTQEFTPAPVPSSALFCAAHSMLADGRKLVVGGAHGASEGIADTNIFDPTTGAWTRMADMATARWYPSTVSLADGRVVVLGGEIHPDVWADTPEVYDPETDDWTSWPTATLPFGNYPRAFLAPNGRIFLASARDDLTSRYLDTNTRTWSVVGGSPFEGSGVMYRPGKILMTGWGVSSGPAAVIDLNEGAPTWRSVAPMQYGRFNQNLVLLPDGQVFVAGGSVDESLVATVGVLPSEIWNPTTETWTTVAPLANPRMYHSHGLLLPDGRVLVGGGGRLAPAIDYPNAEIYSPPYLFKGPRPVIAAAPSTVGWGGSMTVSTPDAASIASVSLIRLASVTHSLDFDQRYIQLAFTTGSDQLTVQAPTNANNAPPGDYMLFIVNGNGVPSTAAMVRLGGGSANQAPTITTATANPVTGPAPLTVNFTGTATDPENDPLAYTWTFGDGGKASGASVSHTYTAGGSYAATLTVSDGPNQVASAPLAISVGSSPDTTPPVVTMTAPADGATVSGSVTLSATASDNIGVAGVQFLLNGAPLGAEDTTAPYSISWNSVSVANGGPYQLSARARDAATNQTTAAAVSVTVNNVTISGLVAAYGFDEGSGTSLGDFTGTGHTGTIAGATWTTSGKYGNALSFDGVNDWVTVNDANDLDLSTGMTLEAWVYPTATGGGTWRNVLIKERSAGEVYNLYANSNTNVPKAVAVLNSSPGQSREVAGTGTLPVNTWTHLATTYDGNALRLYVNSTLVGSLAISGPMLTSTGALRIGGNSKWGEFFQGRIDEVRIYNRALGVGEIQTDMNAPVGTPPSDTTPPVRSNGQPAGTLAAGTTQTTLSLTTNEPAACRFGQAAGVTYAGQPNAFATGNGTSHSAVVSGLVGGASYTFYVRCQDSAANANPDDFVIAFSVATPPVPDTTPPVVTMTAPADAATVSGIVTVSANATDNVGVVGVQFLLNGAPLGAEDTTAPYSISWNSTSVANGGPYQLSARARDAATNQTSATAVSVSVNNVATVGLVAAYSFNEGTGSSLTDISGNGQTGAITGATWTTQGQFGSALAFDGVNDWVTVNDTAALDLTTGMTLEAWVFPTVSGGGTWRNVIIKERPSGEVYNLYANSDINVPKALVVQSSVPGQTHEVAGTSALPVNTWTHLAATYDGSALRLYVNGTLVQTTALSGTLLTSTGVLRIGGNSVWGEFFQGRIDEMRIYNRAITATEIQTDMNAPITP